MPPLPRGDVIGYVPVETSVNDSDVERVDVALTVDAAAIPGDRGRDSIVVYRYANGSWEPLETSYDVSEARYRASANGFGNLAVASLAPGRIEVVNTTEPPDWASPGYNTSVSATVRNPGDRPAERQLTVTVDGRPIATKNVELQPGEERSVEFSFPATPGTVAVNDTVAGRMNVSDSEEWDQDPGTGFSTGEGPGFDLGLVAVVFVALVLAGTAVRVRRRFE